MRKLGAFGSMASRPSYFNETKYPSYSNLCHPFQSLGTRKQAYTECGLSVSGVAKIGIEIPSEKTASNIPQLQKQA